MTKNDKFDELIAILKNIESNIDVLVTIQKASMPEQKVGGEEKKILRLCDRKHAIDEMVKETGKTENNIKVTLSHLREKALIRTVRMKDRIVYERI